jgi:L-amino acid N-acyltransferase YncA
MVSGEKRVSGLPKNMDCKGRDVQLRLLETSEMAAVEIFAKTLPEHDLLFLGRDIQHPKVLQAWAQSLAEGEIVSVAAWSGDEVVGTSAVVCDPLGWSPHVAEIRLLVAETMRGSGLGRALLAESCLLGVDAGAGKLMARMTPDQAGAIAMFEEAGFRGEALLRDHVRDRSGQVFDLVIFSLDVARAGEHRRNYGFSED